MTDYQQPQPNGNEGPEPPAPGARSYFDPIVGISILILLSVFALIGYSMFDESGGLLGRMADSSFARGMITYLFAVVTMGTAVVLVVSALTGGITQTDERKFQRAKEILSLLLGVFGTIVGFYFGSELAESRPTTGADMFLTTPLLDRSEVAAGQSVIVTANVRGGSPPYRYGIALGNESSLDYTRSVGDDGWITSEVIVPATGMSGSVELRLGVIDSNNNVVINTVDLRIVPALVE